MVFYPDDLPNSLSSRICVQKIIVWEIWVLPTSTIETYNNDLLSKLTSFPKMQHTDKFQCNVERFDHIDQQQLFTKINSMLLSMIILQFYTGNKIKA